MDGIGIMAGSGQFPLLVARGARAAGLKVVICGFHDNADPALAREADAFIMVYLSQVGGLIDFFRSNGIRRLCMAGAINKPRALQLPALLLKADARGKAFYARFRDAPRGDDALLRLIASELREEGFEVVRPDELAAGLGGATGILGPVRPNPDMWRDIRLGWETAKRIGAVDIGQCVVVRQGVVVAVEAVEGTDACIERGGRLGGEGCTLVKTLKPGQDKRLDLPCLGAETVKLLAAHKFACLAFDASGTLFFDREAALDLAARHNIAVVAVPEDADAFFAGLEP
jgi:DUF1009 family protein